MFHWQDHLHDVNAFVRSGCIKLWGKLYAAGRVPIPRLKAILPRIGARLSDKSPLVRKEALKFVRAFLTGNPFSSLVCTLFTK